MLSGVVYERIDDAGLHISVDGIARLLAVDHDRRLRRARNRAASSSPSWMRQESGTR